jgi:hypothetical protein
VAGVRLAYDASHAPPVVPSQYRRFEVLVPLANLPTTSLAGVPAIGHSSTRVWVNAPIVAVVGKIITIQPVPATATRVRFLWCVITFLPV